VEHAGALADTTHPMCSGLVGGCSTVRRRVSLNARSIVLTAFWRYACAYVVVNFASYGSLDGGVQWAGSIPLLAVNLTFNCCAYDVLPH